MRVAAVVPVYRRPRLIVQALDSVLAQRRPPDRLVVVDDGSPDATPDVVERWIEDRAPAFACQLLRQANAGVSVARNAGAAAADDCELLAFLDSDDAWQPGYLASLVPAMERTPAAVAATCDKVVVDGERQWRVDNARYSGNATLPLFLRGPSGTSNTIVAADAFRRVDGFEPGLCIGEDLLLMLRLSLLGDWVHVPEVLATYHTGSGRPAGEAPSLGCRFADRRLRRVQNLERFLAEGGADAMPTGVWKRKLSWRWVRASQQLIALKRVDEARACTQRALELWPANPVAWLSRLRLRWIPRGRGPLDPAGRPARSTR